MYNKYSINEESDLGLDFDDYENHEQKNIIPPFNLTDLAFMINDLSLKEKLIGSSKSVKIIKNRFDIDNFEISLKNLNNYNYICNYEYSK